VSGTVVVPWYATGFHADAFGEALNKLAAQATRYGASSYAVHRARDDRYRFNQFASFAEHVDWERYWAGPEMTRFRVVHSGWYQVPIVYGWWDLTASGSLLEEPGAGNGRAGDGAGVVEGDTA
jgi:hypothetical protein